MIADIVRNWIQFPMKYVVIETVLYLGPMYNQFSRISDIPVKTSYAITFGFQIHGKSV